MTSGTITELEQKLNDDERPQKPVTVVPQLKLQQKPESVPSTQVNPQPPLSPIEVIENRTEKETHKQDANLPAVPESRPSKTAHRGSPERDPPVHMELPAADVRSEFREHSRSSNASNGSNATSETSEESRCIVS